MPERKIPVLAEAEVIVAGAGAAGTAAAVRAAQTGASVLLLEKRGYAGGMITGGLLPSIIHMTDGRNMLAGGLCKELVDKLAARTNRPADYHWHNIHPEPLKLLLDELLSEAEVRVLYDTHICDCAVENGEVRTLFVSTVNGLQAIHGKYFIDATGDGHLCALAGVPFEVGDENGRTMAPTLCSLFEHVEYDQIPAERKHSGLGRAEWAEAMASNTAPLAEGHFVGFFRNGPSCGCGNLGHIYGTDPLDPFSVSNAYIEGRKQVQVMLDFFRCRVPGFRYASLAATGAQLGIRESRRIRGDYVLSGDDYYARRHFPDNIGCFAYPIDRHASTANHDEQRNAETKFTSTRLNPGEHYGIPLRALLAKDTVNLMMAGRCISTDHIMQSSIRVVAACMITGEAAGAAAALGAKNHIPIREINLETLQNQLRA